MERKGQADDACGSGGPRTESIQETKQVMVFNPNADEPWFSGKVTLCGQGSGKAMLTVAQAPRP